MNPLQRLYRTKLALLATISTVVGIALLMLSHQLAPWSGWAWSNGVINDLGGAFFTTGLIAIFFQYIDERDSERRADDRLRRVLRQEAPAIRDAVLDGFAFAPDSLTSVASPATLDKIIENCLAIQLGDQELAHYAYDELHRQMTPFDQAQPDHGASWCNSMAICCTSMSGKRPRASTRSFRIATAASGI